MTQVRLFNVLIKQSHLRCRDTQKQIFQDTELLLPRVFLVGVEEQHASVEQQDWMSSLKDEASHRKILGQRLGY